MSLETLAARYCVNSEISSVEKIPIILRSNKTVSQEFIYGEAAAHCSKLEPCLKTFKCLFNLELIFVGVIRFPRFIFFAILAKDYISIDNNAHIITSTERFLRSCSLTSNESRWLPSLIYSFERFYRNFELTS